ncbi:ABC transporter, ATP-binding protein, partial [mine drainage metagenome]
MAIKSFCRDLNQRIDQEDRIALLGSNGNGKSTFAKLIAGMITPLSGELYRSEKLDVAYFHQHQIEALHIKETAFQHLSPLMREARPEQVRARLGQFGFAQEKADVAVEKLSGGEKAR